MKVYQREIDAGHGVHQVITDEDKKIVWQNTFSKTNGYYEGYEYPIGSKLPHGVGFKMIRGKKKVQALIDWYYDYNEKERGGEKWKQK